MNTYFVEKSDFINFLNKLSEKFHTFYLKSKETQFDWKKGRRVCLFWQEYKGNLDNLVLGEVRAQDPLKQFTYFSKEKVSENFKSLEDKQEKPILLIGAKNCDLRGLDITDFVFMGDDYSDPFYVKRRQSMFIIASDCTNPIDACFCGALDIKPYPQKKYDMGVSDIGDGYVIEIISERASNYVYQYRNKFKPTLTLHLQKREQLRNDTINGVEENIAKYNMPRRAQLAGIMEGGFDSDIWQEEVKTCVECGCCNVVCPTCHCFLLSDAKKEDKNIRYKVWDACLYKDFAAVAGGANPRKRIFQRLRNRYDKKFRYFPNVLGQIACTGCGRCITGCPAKIDIRLILKNLVTQAQMQTQR